jgi:SAM-dependent methyltransferase
MPADFEKQSYWEKRFAAETAFEWLTTSAAFMDVLAPYLQNLPLSSPILHLGSGTSDLHNYLRQHGFTDITNVDYEPRALERGQQLELQHFGDIQTKYLVADATQLKGQEKYRVVIDKSTADAIACGGDEAIAAMADSIHRSMDKDGFWVSLSFSPWRFEDVQPLFDVQVICKVPTPKRLPSDPDLFHYCYLLKPKG